MKLRLTYIYPHKPFHIHPYLGRYAKRCLVFCSLLILLKFHAHQKRSRKTIPFNANRAMVLVVKKISICGKVVAVVF